MKRRDIKAGDRFKLSGQRSIIDGRKARVVEVTEVYVYSPTNIVYDATDGHNIYVGLRATDLRTIK